MSASSRMLIGADIIRPEMSRDEVEQRMRELTGRPDLMVFDVHPKLDAQGKTLGYEVDIR